MSVKSFLLLFFLCGLSASLLFFSCGLSARTTSAPVRYEASDSLTVERLLRIGRTERGDENRMIYYGKKFLDVPYVAHTLEVGDEEQLVVNLSQMDCTTFVEYVAALAMCDMKGQGRFKDFCDNLTRIRYRNGVIDGYASRLHYFTWWGEDNEKMNIVEEIVSDKAPFTAVQTVQIDYMSSHPSLYKRLRSDASPISLIKEYERATNGKRYRYIPKSRLGGTREQLASVCSGDIVSIITNKRGLDTSHVGIAVWQNGRLHLMHASSLKKKVVLDSETFYNYSKKQASQLGIRVYRLKLDMNNLDMNKEDNSTGAFAASVLLSENKWDIKKLVNDCITDWNIEIPCSNDDSSLVVMMGNTTLVVALMPAPVPNEEAEYYASANYMWKDAVEAAKSHKAHILISALGKDASLLETGKLFTKVVSSCLKQEHAIAVYTDGAVFQPQFYREVASFIQQDEDALPILDWVWFGVCYTDEYTGIYTYGMRKFGKEEMEVCATNANLNDVRNFLLDIVTYVLDSDVILKDGDTIGLSEEQKLRVTLSDAVALEGKSLKLEYPQ
ncbi:MAG: DUF1460 domain-containing protein [Prevotellaceae bacterium]|nr:DUF1460 domain-containing protein [Prevotellaceae bacterium]